MSNCQNVKSQFFQPFYHDRVTKVYSTTPPPGFDLAVLKFWCSVVDFYGGIYYVGKNNAVQIHRGAFKLASGASFALFVQDFFPSPEKHYGKFIYNVFRSGIVHQLSPKRSGVHWIHPSRTELVWVEIDATNPDPSDNKVAHINLKLFQEMTYQAYINFLNMIDTNSNPTICDNIYNNLISVPDVFEDGKSLDKAYVLLKNSGHDIKRP